MIPIKIDTELQDWFRRELLKPYDDCDRARLGYYKWRNKGLIYEEAANKQVMWVRDKLINAISRSLWEKELRNNGIPKFFVVGEHRSKSCALPVYYINLGFVRLVMRNNFYDWNISVDSDSPIIGDIQDTINSDTYCFFQGFPSDWKFSQYDVMNNNKRFSFWVTSDEELFVFFWLLSRILIGVK